MGVLNGSINCMYLSSNRLNQRLNASLHFKKLASIFSSDNGEPRCNDLSILKQQLANNRSPIIYFLAHSERKKGMYIGENANVNGDKLGSMLHTQTNRIPKIIIFNTCYGIQSGLVGASLKAGVQTVVATERTIPIAHMCAYIESLLENWQYGGLSLNKTVLQTNQAFKRRSVEFAVYKSYTND